MIYEQGDVHSKPTCDCSEHESKEYAERMETFHNDPGHKDAQSKDRADDQSLLE